MSAAHTPAIKPDPAFQSLADIVSAMPSPARDADLILALSRAEALGYANGLRARPEPAAIPEHFCRCCGEPCPDGFDCCTDEFPEPGEIRETGR